MHNCMSAVEPRDGLRYGGLYLKPLTVIAANVCDPYADNCRMK